MRAPIELLVFAVISLSNISRVRSEPLYGAVVEARAPEGRVARWESRLRIALAARGGRPLDALFEPEPTAFVVRPERVRAFSEVERLITEARAARAALREGLALRLLSRALGIAEEHADVPGSAAFLAEVHTALGISAEQAGRPRLFEVALARAATLDGTRQVRSAEAPPPVVARAAAISQAVKNRPSGIFEVRADAAGARVYLDDHPLGVAPRTVRAKVGLHVLRVEAPGHLAWGEVVDVLEGARAPLTVALAPSPRMRAARELRTALSRGAPAPIVLALRAFEERPTVWLLEVGGGPRERALFLACSAEGCAPPRRLESDASLAAPSGAAGALSPRASARALGRARAWLREPSPEPAPPAPLSSRWVLLTGVGAAVASIVLAVALATRPAPEQRLDVIVEPGDL